MAAKLPIFASRHLDFGENVKEKKNTFPKRLFNDEIAIKIMNTFILLKWKWKIFTPVEF